MKNTEKFKFIPQPLNCLGNCDVEIFQSTLFSPINLISSKKELTMGKQTIQWSNGSLVKLFSICKACFWAVIFKSDPKIDYI